MDFNRSDGRLIYNTLVMLAYMMDNINPGHHWKQRLGKLFDDHSHVSARSMGFPDDWRERATWKGRLA